MSTFACGIQPLHYGLGRNKWGGFISCYLQILLGKTLTPAAVSSFFLISGYLYFTSITDFSKGVYVNKTKKRTRSLLIPFFLWNLAGVLILLVLRWIKDGSLGLDSSVDFLSLFWCCNVWNENTINIIGIHTPLFAPIDWPLWYLRDLIVMSLLSPLIYWAVKKLKLWYFIILVPFYIMNIWTIIPGLGLSSFIFFGLGVYLAIHKGSLIITGNKILIVFLVTVAHLIALLSAYLWTTQGITTFNYSIYVLATTLLVPTILILGCKASEIGIQGCKLLVESSFFVYAAHAFPCVNPIVIVKTIARALHIDSSLLCYLFSPFIVYAITVFIYYLIKRYFPRTIQVICGR